MLTQCPSCQTIFRITSEILRVAHGQVRCGRCHTQFDALARLIEENEVEETSSGRYVKPEPPAAAIEVDEPPAQEDITLEGRHIEITGTYRVMDDPEDPQIRQEVTEEWVDLDEVDEEILDEPPADDGIEVSEHDADIDEFEAVEEVDEEGISAPPADESEQQRFARRLASGRQRVLEESTSDEELHALAGRSGATRTPLLWSILAAPLVLALLAQFVHHYRADFARNPTLGPLVVRIYETFGIQLTPDWQLHAYEVKQWGVVSDASQPGTLKVRASVTNRAGFPQPYPLLKLMLEDRWGDQVRAREFEPAEYLDPGTPTNRLLPPGQPTNATITIVDPGPDAEGFRFDICLRSRTNAVVCASEVPQ
ncbi:MAG TPA: DUF3426 domain-containing protein [Povalibacter sp.]|uniref:DUF3426 domain-containing protein n=1 Tax=Povalibacter sp. TaxID=1962978 RepID=UPI002C9D41E3|nr:DUF3426 domain-containing protein [Povalibacter sp.]HMN45763.1 DUF3426 domain-containing protein [Povalibacter sp.]